ncbi:MAG: winged helix-turn-helix domain-containing protein, partial [Nitrososphaera sp.]
MKNLSEVRDSPAGIFRRGARGTIDIIADILSLCGSSAGRTNIMYKANLSHQMLKFYLWHTVELGLLEESNDAKFTITEKGKQFLACYQEIS